MINLPLNVRASCAVLLVAVVALSSGCASIVHSGSRSITVNSTPSGAKVTITKSDTGDAVHGGTTPLTVSLDPKRGYFKGQAYTLKFELPGYRTGMLMLQPQLSGWYFGNILIGGVIGMVVVDPLTGSMWNLSPDKIEQHLEPAQTAQLKRPDTFRVVLLSQLTERERASMVRLN